MILDKNIYFDQIHKHLLNLTKTKLIIKMVDAPGDQINLKQWNNKNCEGFTLV